MTSAPRFWGWCGRPRKRRRYTEEAFGRVTVKDPTLCAVCAALLALVPGRDGAQLHDSARELALDVVGRGEPVGRPEPVALSAAQLRKERDEARAVARLLAAEVAASTSLAGEAAPLLRRFRFGSPRPLKLHDRVVAADHMTEDQVVAAYCAHLSAAGWDVRTEVDGADVVATRAGETVIAEAKGHTAAPGLDVDTMFGQMLRRMSDAEQTSYAVVVPRSLVDHVRRVAPAVRASLRVTVFAVDDDGSVGAVD